MSNTFKCRQVDKYDGQSIYAGGKIVYELGNYLGGGASGSVYQAFDPSWPEDSDKSVAIKILNPLGYKNIIFGQINQCPIAAKGSPLTSEQIQGKQAMTYENIWWLLHPNLRILFAAFEDPHRMQLRELPLTKCVEIWGMNPLNISNLTENEVEKLNLTGVAVHIDKREYKIPQVSPKYLKFLKSRQLVCREMSNMVRIGEHPNIIDLFEVLELIQDSKTTLFLVLDMINGGELFERMKMGNLGNTEEFARKYFSQLISGIEYCHKKGIVHRDLKPENLLLSDPSDEAILKIADFGLSAVVFAAESTVEHPQSQNINDKDTHQILNKSRSSNSPIGAHSNNTMLPDTPGSLRRLRSVVGSPHYIAPEIANDDPAGYDGRKVDMWSAGIILYSMFTGSLPFGGELSICPRFKRYKSWLNTEYNVSLREGRHISLPPWFWPSNISPIVGDLLVGLLQCDPILRLTASDAMKHPWFRTSNLKQPIPSISERVDNDISINSMNSLDSYASPMSLSRYQSGSPTNSYNRLISGSNFDTSPKSRKEASRDASLSEQTQESLQLADIDLNVFCPQQPNINHQSILEQQRIKELAANDIIEPRPGRNLPTNIRIPSPNQDTSFNPNQPYNQDSN